MRSQVIPMGGKNHSCPVTLPHSAGTQWMIQPQEGSTRPILPEHKADWSQGQDLWLCSQL